MGEVAKDAVRPRLDTTIVDATGVFGLGDSLSSLLTKTSLQPLSYSVSKEGNFDQHINLGNKNLLQFHDDYC